MNEHLEFAKSLAYDAGKIMTHYFTHGVKTTIKADSTPVTEADKEINRMVINEVKKRFPQHGILGEEISYNSHLDTIWVTDPIDGTLPFSLGIPTNVFSLALVVHGEPTLGVIYDPYLDRLYYAQKGGGTFLNDTKIATSKKPDLQRSLIYMPTRIKYFDIDYVHNCLRDEKVKMPKYFSATYGLCQVAAGKFNAMLFSNDSVWDVAAAKIIVEEAGGVTSDVFGKPQKYNGPIKGFVASGTHELHYKLISLIAKSMKL